MITLYELCGVDSDIRFSPAVWRIRMMLLHKGLEWESVTGQFLDKDVFAASGCKTYPVIKDGDQWVGDSWKIALHLEAHNKEKPFMGMRLGAQQCKFFRNWETVEILGRLFPMFAVEVPKLLDAENAAYFRSDREKRLGRTLEEASAGRDASLVEFRKALTPVRLLLKNEPFLGGDFPMWMDYSLFGCFMWIRCIAEDALVLEGDLIYDWEQRMLDLYGGHARAAKTRFSKN